MISEYKQKFPEWVNDTTSTYNLCLSDDLDSLMSCAVLKMIKGYTINHFYNFKSIHSIDPAATNTIFVDIDTIKNKCWSNHVTLLSANDTYNLSGANLNILDKISRENYFNKYLVSTFLQIISYYDVFDYKKLSDLQKMIIWCIDSSFIGHYSNFPNDKAAHQKFIEILEIQELASVLHKYSRQEFMNVKKEYVDGKIRINQDRILDTDINLEKLKNVFPELNLSLPLSEFTLLKELKPPGRYKLAVDQEFKSANIKGLFSIALTRKNEIKYTIA